MVRLATIAFIAVLLAPVGVSAAPQDATARALLTTWKAEDPSARLAASSGPNSGPNIGARLAETSRDMHRQLFAQRPDISLIGETGEGAVK
jgi:hypothetical protein